MKGSKDLADYRPFGIFIDWEVPGMFDVDLQIRNLSLKAIPNPWPHGFSVTSSGCSGAYRVI
jgi:hypothetical protein